MMNTRLEKIETLVKKNGKFEFNGKEYVLTQQAYLDNNMYSAMAICVTDTADKDGWQPCYSVEWDVIDPNAEDEGDNACWDDPIEVRLAGEYNLEENRIF